MPVRKKNDIPFLPPPQGERGDRAGCCDAIMGKKAPMDNGTARNPCSWPPRRLGIEHVSFVAQAEGKACSRREGGFFFCVVVVAHL